MSLSSALKSSAYLKLTKLLVYSQVSTNLVSRSGSLAVYSLRDVNNSSYDTKAEFNNCFILFIQNNSKHVTMSCAIIIYIPAGESHIKVRGCLSEN